MLWQTDIDASEVTLRVRCTNCRQEREVTIWRESLGDYAPNGDGTYTALVGECGECLACLERLTPDQPVKRPSPELIALAEDEERELTEVDVVDLVHRIVDDGGEYGSYDLTLEQVERLKRKGHIHFCAPCTRDTIVWNADNQDGRTDYTAAEYHTTKVACDVKDYEAYLAMILQASVSDEAPQTMGQEVL